jgi:hypothetical protein
MGVPGFDGVLGVGEFFVAAMVAAVVDEFLGRGEVLLWRLPRVLSHTVHC